MRVQASKQPELFIKLRYDVYRETIVPFIAAAWSNTDSNARYFGRIILLRKFVSGIVYEYTCSTVGYNL